MMKIIVSCFIDTLILFWFNRRLDRRKGYAAVQAACFFGMAALTVFMNKNGMDSVHERVFMSLLFYIGITWILYRVPVKAAAARSAELMCSAILAELSVSVILMFQQKSNALEQRMKTVFFWAAFLLIARSIELIFLNFINSIRETHREIVKRLGWSVLVLLAILGYLYFIVSCMLMEKTNYAVFQIAFVVNIVMIYGFIIGFFVFIRQRDTMEAQKREIELLSKKAQFQTEYYKQISDYKKQMRRVYHDLKNHVLVAGQLENDSLREKYLVSLNEYFTEFDRKTYTGNEVLDLLVDEKKKSCEAGKIRFECSMDLSDGSFMNLIDVCVIFGNILDNAIEACERYEGEKYIKMFADSYNDFLVIKSENSTKLESANTKFLPTQKKDYKNHGLGMGCIQDSLDKYGGTFNYEVKDHVFKMNIIIPIKR